MKKISASLEDRRILIKKFFFFPEQRIIEWNHC